MTATPDEPAVLMPPGLPLDEAATWVGRACWAELRLHAVLTDWLSVESEGARVEGLWHERSDAAERAAAWHRRLPELRERPRAASVVASSAAVANLFDGLDALRAPETSSVRHGALAAVLEGLRRGYVHHQGVAVGPADGPVSVTLEAALRCTFGAGGADPDSGWTSVIEQVGGLP